MAKSWDEIKKVLDDPAVPSDDKRRLSSSFRRSVTNRSV